MTNWAQLTPIDSISQYDCSPRTQPVTVTTAVLLWMAGSQGKVVVLPVHLLSYSYIQIGYPVGRVADQSESKKESCLH